MDHFWIHNGDSDEYLRNADLAAFPTPKYAKRYIDAAFAEASRKCLVYSYSHPDLDGNEERGPPEWKTIDGVPVSPPPEWEPDVDWEPWTEDEIEEGKEILRRALDRFSTPTPSVIDEEEKTKLIGEKLIGEKVVAEKLIGEKVIGEKIIDKEVINEEAES